MHVQISVVSSESHSLGYQRSLYSSMQNIAKLLMFKQRRRTNKFHVKLNIYANVSYVFERSLHQHRNTLSVAWNLNILFKHRYKLT